MCNLDVEIAKIQTDLTWIKNSNKVMQKDIDDIKGILTKENERINKINKTIYGNGDYDNSLTNRTKKLEGYVNKVKGAVGLVAILGISNVLVIIKLLS